MGGIAKQPDFEMFGHDLEILQDGRLRTLPAFDQTIDHTGKIPTDVSRYERMAGLYLSDEATSIWDGDRDVDNIEFTPRPWRRIGRETSRREVFFGDFSVPVDEEPVRIPVAVKPFLPDAFHLATHETGMYQYFDQLEVPSFEVLGMLVSPSGYGKPPRSYVITAFEPGIQSLENTDWREMTPEERWGGLKPANDTLSTIHSHAVSHGDFELKNVVVGEEDQAIFVADPEYSVSFRDMLTPYESNPSEVAQVVRKMSVDLSALCKSVDARLCDSGATDAEKFEDTLEFVYGPYYANLCQIDSPYQDALKAAFEIVLDQKRQQAYGEWGGKTNYYS